MMTSVLGPLRNRVHDAPMATEQLCDAAGDEIENLRAVMKGVAFALDGIVDGDFTPNGKTARSALQRAVAILND